MKTHALPSSDGHKNHSSNSLAFAISQIVKFANHQCLREAEALIYFFLLMMVVKEAKLMDDKNKNQIMGRGRGWKGT